MCLSLRLQFEGVFFILFTFYSFLIIMSSIRSLLVLWILCLLWWFTYAAFSADTFIAQFHAQEINLSSVEKQTYYSNVYTTLSSLALKSCWDAEQYNLYTSLKEYVQDQIDGISTWSTSSIDDQLPDDFDSPAPVSTVSAGMNIPHVDLVRVRAAWLALHNAERKTKWLAPFTYTPALEWTATTWAKYLAAQGRNTWLHKRWKSWSIYSYSAIQQRFLNQWIVFASKDGTLFSESIGRNYYSCKKADCTDDFIKAIKKTRSFFMSEKPCGPHYNAIVGDYPNIWLWVALVGNKYYLVTHYTQALK